MQNLNYVKYQSDELLYSYDNETGFSSCIPTHIHEGWEFLFVKNGEFSYRVDGNVFDIKPGSLLIARPGAIHALYPKGVIRYERHCLVLTGDLLIQDIIQQIPSNLYVLDVSDNPVISGLYDRISFYRTNLQGQHLDNTLRNMIHELWMNVYIHIQTHSKSVVSSSNPIVRNAIKYIKVHIREPLTVEQVSSALFITPRYLHQCFTKHMNVSPKQYIMLQKLQLVQQALINAENPTEVCQHYGFSNYSTFYRNYQKVFGRRPSDSPKQSLQRIDL